MNLILGSGLMVKKKTQTKKKTTKKGKGGRPTLFTKKNTDSIISYIENGNSYTDACFLSGVSEAIFYEWKRRGNEALQKGIKNEFSQFLEKVKQAKRKYKAWLIQNVNKHAELDGKLSLDVLSRKYPEEYGRKDYYNIKANIKGKIGVTMDDLYNEAEKWEKENKK